MIWEANRMQTRWYAELQSIPNELWDTDAVVV